MKRTLAILIILIFAHTLEAMDQQAPRRSDQPKIRKTLGNDWVDACSNKHTFAQTANINTSIQTKYASTFFEHWIKYQHIYEKKSLYQHSAYRQFGTKALNDIIKKIDPSYREFVSNLLGNDFLSGKDKYPDTNTLNQLLFYLSNKCKEFVKLLTTLSFINQEIEAKNAFEYKKDDLNKSVSRYAKLAKLLFFCSEKTPCEQFNFNLANSCFEYLFYWHKGNFNPLFEQKENYQILRFMYSIIYRQLIEIGWIHWSKQSLKRLKTASEAGTTITYVAGGCDIYQLVKNGIYNIVVIDPFLPFQEKYYIDDFLWFVEGTIGDTLIFDNVDKYKQIIARRNFFTNHHSPITITSPNGKKLTIPKTTTVWILYDYKGNKIGFITFIRRLCTQNDFKNKIVLMSLNEALLAFSPKIMNGWSMKARLLSDDFHMYIKQLHNPISKHELENYAYANEKSSFEYINLCTLGV